MAASASLLVLASAAVARAAEHGSEHQHSEQKTSPMAERLKGLSGKEFEVSFLTNMVHHHRMAVEMGKLAHGRSGNAIHDLSHEMMDKQKAEIEQMTRWLQEWHARKLAEMNRNDPSMKKSMEAMQKLKQLKGTEFDELFVQEMSTHHAEGIQLANLAKSKAEHDELRRFAAQIASDQQKDIQKLKDAKKS